MRLIRLALVFLLCGCTAPHHAVLLTAPRCSDEGVFDIGNVVDEHERLFRRAFRHDAVVVHTQASVHRALERASSPAMLVYSGHGVLDVGRTALCVQGDHVPVERLVRDSRDVADSRSRGPLTILLGTCMSANADLRKAGREVSILSASSEAVSPDSRFAEAAARAIEAADLDENCDGLVTDQELFERLLHELGAYEAAGSVVPFTDLQAKPRLQRHAMSHLPLPIASRCSPRSAAPRLKDEREANELQRELDKQERATREPGNELPQLGWDYYTIDAEPGTSGESLTSLRAAIAARRHCGPAGDRACAVPFPGTDDEAMVVARYAIFTEIFRIELRWSYGRVVRLRDGALIATRNLGTPNVFDGLVATLPLRFREVTAKNGIERIALDSATADRISNTWKATPCTTELLGECFEENQ